MTVHTLLFITFLFLGVALVVFAWDHINRKERQTDNSEQLLILQGLHGVVIVTAGAGAAFLFTWWSDVDKEYINVTTAKLEVLPRLEQIIYTSNDDNEKASALLQMHLVHSNSPISIAYPYEKPLRDALEYSFGDDWCSIGTSKKQDEDSTYLTRVHHTIANHYKDDSEWCQTKQQDDDDNTKGGKQGGLFQTPSNSQTP